MKHRTGKNRQQMFFSSIDDMVSNDSFARVIDVFVDQLPLDELGFSHANLNHEGNEPYHPSDLFKLLIYRQRFGVRSTNRLAKACKINLEVTWMLKGLDLVAVRSRGLFTSEGPRSYVAARARQSRN